MGIIEDSIYRNYRKAIEDGRLDQAQKSIDIIKYLREKVELESYVDYTLKTAANTVLIEKVFEPIPYRYYPNEGVVVIKNTAINLTQSENKLFYLFSVNESNLDKFKLISGDTIKNYVFSKTVTKQAIRLAVKRLRSKIEPDNKDPQMIINVYNKGYIFMGKRIRD